MSTRACATLVLAVVAGFSSASCFDPELRPGIACSARGTCPGPLECVDRRCVAVGEPTDDASASHPDAASRPIDASEPDIDASPVPDADAPPDGAPPPDQDAGNRIECSPVFQNCIDADQPRCTLIITQQGPPHDAFLGCALDRSPKATGDICGYVHAGDRGLEDDCGSGLICDHDGRCRLPCSGSDECGFEETCQPFQDISQDLSPHGLCQP